MTLFVFKIILILISIVFLHINLTRFLHIFQLTFYNFTEFFPTIKKTKEIKFGVGQLSLVILWLFSAIFNQVWNYVLWTVVLIVVMYYTNMFKPKAKKKFVITKRVKITYAVSYIFETILLILPLVYFAYMNTIPFYFFALFLAMYKYTGILFASIGNFITKGIMKIENKKYINEAKEIINSNKNMKIVGITGSYGKTSTKNIVYAILNECFSTVMTPKSFNTTLGVVRSIRENIRPYTEVFVCEMGAARLGEIKEICDIVSPDFSVITSIGPQHLTSFKTIENVQKGKFEIVTNAKKDAVAILNVDNSYIASGIDMYAKDKKVIRYGTKNSENIDYRVENISMNENGSTFDLIHNNEKLTFETKLLGKHNIYNIMCAAIVARQLGASNENIIKAVKKVRPIEHGLELKKMGNILALDDSFNSNPEGSKAAIECLSLFKDKYKVIVTPGMIELGDKDYELNKKLGKYCTRCDYVILVGTKTTKAIKDGMDEEGYKNYLVVKDVYEAFKKLNNIKASHENLITLFENDLPDSYS